MSALSSYNVAPNFNDGIGSVLPIGSILMWSTSNAPSGFLLCDGSAVSRQSFAPLFSVIGTTWGSGNGSTTFNVPNTANRVVRGVGSNYTQASTGGAESVTLSANQLPNHSHLLFDPSHNHPAVFQGTGFASADGGNGNRADFPGTTSVAQTGLVVNDSLLTQTTSNVVGTQVTQVATSLVNTYIAINHIIKAQ